MKTTQEVDTRYGKFRIPSDGDLISAALLTYGEWAQEEINVFAQFIQPGDTVFDIGGFIGTHARAFSEIVGPKGQVFSFEASKSNFSILSANVELATHDNITPISKAVGDSDLKIWIDDLDASNAGAKTVQFEGRADGEIGEQIALDNAQFPAPSFIKIDVEGHEANVLRGAASVISSSRPVIFAEANRLDGTLAVLEFAFENDFAVFGINIPAFNPNNFNKHPEDIYHGGTECGLILVPQEKIEIYHVILKTIAPLESADDLLLLLLNKPQYALGFLHELAAASVLDVPFVDLGSQVRKAHENAKDQLATSHAELSKTKRELAAQNMRFSEAVEQINDAKRLANATLKFPFGLYFKKRKKYFKIIKSLQSYGSPTGQGVKQKGDESESIHPAGYRADLLKNLKPLASQIVVGSTGDVENHLPDGFLQKAFSDGKASERSLVVSFSHDDYSTVVGGTQLCIQREAEAAQAAGIDYLNLHPMTALRTLAGEEQGGELEISTVFNGQKVGKATYNQISKQVEEIAAQGVQVRVVVHHLLGHLPEQVCSIAKAARQDLAWVWLHDFFTICPGVNLLRNSISYCGAPSVDSASCGICIYGKERAAHLDRLASLFETLKIHVISPSEATAKLWEARSGFPVESINVAPHVDLKWEKHGQEQLQTKEFPIKIGFVGAPLPHKGWEVFTQLHKTHSENAMFKFVYLGNYDIEQNIERKEVSVQIDNPTAMADAIRESNIDLVVHFAIWPETFSFTTYEAMSGGAGVLTNPVSGNIAAEVKKNGLGAVLEDFGALEAFLGSDEMLDLVKTLRTRRASHKAIYSISKMSIPYVSGSLT